jgi:predicted metal-dependent phosphoesterase TrpH
MTPGLRLDLHVHSVLSPDGRDDVGVLVERAATVGLDGLALTDHNTTRGLGRLGELRSRHPQLRLLAGVEVSTRDGHLLAYGLREPPPARRPVEETAEWVVARGGVPVLAHPVRLVHGVGPRLASRVRVPALESVNGHNGASANARAGRLARSRSLGSTGGSDAHASRDLGRAWTRFPEGADSVEDLLSALGRGATTGEGRGASPVARIELALRSLSLRIGRRFRPI